MCVQVTKTANQFEISSLLEKILLKQVRWCLTFVGLYIKSIYICQKLHFAYLRFISIPALSFLFVLGRRIYISLLVFESLRFVLYFVYVHHF
jgi:hypothetical protein